MAFSHTRQEVHAGNKRIVFGTYNAASTTGGDIETGLMSVDSICLTPSGAAVTNAAVYNETLPLSNAGGKVTIVCGSSEVGSFIAIGI